MKLRFNLTQLMTFLVIGGLLFIASCKKETSQNGSANEQENQASLASSESDGEAEMIFNGIFDDAMGANDDVGMAGTGIFGRSTATNSNGSIDAQRPNACHVVTVTHLSTSSVFPVRVVVDFGTAGCQGRDGHVRYGKIITEYTGRLIAPGSIATSIFDGFYIDSIKVEGTHKITNTSSPNNRQFTAEVIDAKLSKPNGNYTEWNSKKIITQMEGLGTPNYPLDDIFKIEGASHGRVQKSTLLVAWEAAVTEPLIKRFNCRWIVRGRVRQMRVNTNTNSPWVAVLDFGSGDCDNLAVITINGVSHNITLH